VFGGDVAGNFRAFDDATGEVLWQANIGAPVSGYPVSFAVDGKQYIAVTTGPSLVAAAARRVTPELTGDSGAGQVVVFALP
jgi:alcohol dehydrogenase (cytochrome c)